jgi:hypothetical protein
MYEYVLIMHICQVKNFGTKITFELTCWRNINVDSLSKGLTYHISYVQVDVLAASQVQRLVRLFTCFLGNFLDLCNNFHVDQS